MARVAQVAQRGSNLLVESKQHPNIQSTTTTTTTSSCVFCTSLEIENPTFYFSLFTALSGAPLRT
jgi:hypothetical protein